MRSLYSLLLFLSCLMTSAQSEVAARSDVLFIAIDDMNDWTTLFNEDNPIQTPNLKRLAARGAFFSKAYCAVPACNPSRTAILTGLSPVTSGVYGNGNSWKKLLPEAVTLPQYFGQHGFATKGGGKIFHHGGAGTDREDKPSFNEFFKLRIHSGKPETNHNGYRRGEPGVRGPTFKRATYKTKALNSKGYHDGTGDKTLDGEVTDSFDLIQRLSKSNRVRQSFIRHAFRYFMGSNEMLSDSQTLIDADNAYLKSGGSYKAVIVSLLTSDSFMYRK